MERDETKAGKTWKALDRKLSDMQHGKVISKHSEFRIKYLREDLDERYARKLVLASKNQYCLKCDRYKVDGKCPVEDGE